MVHQQLQECIEACLACSTACSHCATESLKERDLEHMVMCIQLDLECASICRGAAEIMSLGSKFGTDLCRICISACTLCAQECEKHGEMGMEHCRDCAIACQNCIRVCKALLT